MLQEKEKQIRENIDKRYNMIVSNQRRMLNSILKRPGRGYALLQRAESEATNIFLILANLVIQKGVFPDKWRKGLIYPISKNENWGYSLARTRPIVLLETFRKNVVRIVQKRLSKVFIE